MPPGSLVPRDWVLEHLPDGSPSVPASETPTPPARVDLRIRDLAKLFEKQPSTVRAWVERGDFPGAYKLYGKEWRVPPAALDAFQRAQRARTATPQAEARIGLAAWRSARRSQRGSHHDTER